MMTEANEAALLPCPFCGREPERCDDNSYGSAMVLCPCPLEPSSMAETPAEAAAIWNRRPTITQVSQDVEPAALTAEMVRRAVSESRVRPTSGVVAEDIAAHLNAAAALRKAHAVSQDVPAPAAGVREALQHRMRRHRGADEDTPYTRGYRGGLSDAIGELDRAFPTAALNPTGAA